MQPATENKRLVLENDPGLIKDAIDRLTAVVAEHLGEIRCQELAVALNELILNAMEHGNLEISYDEKKMHLTGGTYSELVFERKKDPRFADRRVIVDYRMNSDGLCFTITDEGPGFDWRVVIGSLSGGRPSYSPHGRGLILAQYYADNLEFNERGNEVRLSIFTDSAGAV